MDINDAVIGILLDRPYNLGTNWFFYAPIQQNCPGFAHQAIGPTGNDDRPHNPHRCIQPEPAPPFPRH